MDRFYNSKRQSATIYDIFKACRLCGSGGGYKMPIIQNITNDDNVIEVEAELKQKIKECVSILVQADDRMPPLICELCVDKVNDFFEFREMCKSTNTRVRGLLGLPPQNVTQETSEDCILGVSGPVFNSSKNEADSILSIKRSSRSGKTSSKEKSSSKKSSSPTLASLIIDRKTRSTPVAQPTMVDTRNSKKRKIDILPSAPKKLRFSAPAAPPRSTSPDYLVRKDKRGSAPPSKHSKAPPKDAAVSANVAKKSPSVSAFPCTICSAGFSKIQSLRNHQVMTHTVSIIEDRMGCSPCREAFNTVKEAESHHRWHRTSNTFYNCTRCSADFRAMQGYNSHFTLKQCIPETVVPDVSCEQCRKKFATKTWMDQHKCRGPPPLGGDCLKCLKHFNGQSQLRRHAKICKGTLLEVNPSNPHLKELRPISIRVDKCDQLLNRIKRESGGNESEHRETVYDLSAINITVKTEPEDRGYENPLACNATIKQEIKEEPPDYGYEDTGFGDNYSSDSDAETAAPRPNLVLNPFARRNKTQVDSLSIISLRSIFSDKMIKKKKKPKKKKIIKLEPTDASYDAFNNLLQMQETGQDDDARHDADDFWSRESQNVEVNNCDNDATDGSARTVEDVVQNDGEVGRIEGSNENISNEKGSEDIIQNEDGKEADSAENSEEMLGDKEPGETLAPDGVHDEQCNENGPVVVSDVKKKESDVDPSVEDLLLNDAVATLAKDKTTIDDDDDLDFDPFASMQGDLPASVLKNRGAFKMASAFIGGGDRRNEVDKQNEASDDFVEKLDGVSDDTREVTEDNAQAITTIENMNACAEEPSEGSEGSAPEFLTRALTERNLQCNDSSGNVKDSDERSSRLVSETGQDGEIMPALSADDGANSQSDIIPHVLDESNKRSVSEIDNVENTQAILETKQNDNSTNILNDNNECLTSESDNVENTPSTLETEENDAITDVLNEDSRRFASDEVQNDEKNVHLPLEGDDITRDDVNEVISSSKDEESDRKADEIYKKDGASDTDILDLVSDSGDDCNILEDTLDKNALEEQLLLEDDPKTDAEETRQNIDNEDELLLGEDDVERNSDGEGRSDILDSEEAELLKDSTADKSSESAGVVTSVIVDRKSQQADRVGETHLTQDLTNMDIGHGVNRSPDEGKRVKSKGECKVVDSEKMDLDTVSDDDFDMDM